MAILLLLGTILGAWICSRVSIAFVAQFVSFELLYTLIPGCALYLLLSPAPGGRLRTVAVGWSLGYAIEVGAFALTAGLHARGAFTFLPLVALLAVAPLLPRASGRERLRGCFRLGRRGGAVRAAAGELSDFVPVLAAVAAATLLLAFTFFAASPLPEHARSVAYGEDNVFDVTLAAEARHHWPITESWIAGQPLRYYTGVFIHAAAINQVTGVPLATVFFRMLPTTMFLIAALQLWALGRSVGRSRWIGPLAAVLLLVTQDVNLNPTQSQVFHIDPFTQFPLSPSFAFGIPFFLGALLLIQSRFAATTAVTGAPDPAAVSDCARRTGTAGWLTMVGVLSAGAAAAKAFGAFDLLAGLALYWLWRTARGRGSRELTCALATCAAAIVAIYFLMIAGGGSATLGVSPLNFLHEGDTLARATVLAKRIAGPSLYWLVLAAGSGVLAVCLLAPLLGAGWLIWRERGVSDSIALLVCVFVVGLGAYVLLGAPGGVEGVFLVYGYIALVPVAAKGLVRLWSETPVLVKRGLLRACGALLALGLAIATLTPALALSGTARYAWFALAYGSVAAGIALTVWRFQGRYAIASRPARVVACCIPLVSALALVKPVTLAGSGALKTLAGKPTSRADTPSEYGMTAPLYRGLLWVRAHTTPCDVLAVSNHFENAKHDASVYFYYSAFTERRVFLESWRYTAGGQYGGLPYPARLALNNAAVARGEPAALRQLQRDGVSYVLIDKTHGGGAPEPPSVSKLIFANSALDVYRLLPPSFAVSHVPRGCATIT
jgi:4-amino-4-deoxy-L-arabinose transferase-like glycosyltransferase